MEYDGMMAGKTIEKMEKNDIWCHIWYDIWYYIWYSI